MATRPNAKQIDCWKCKHQRTRETIWHSCLGLCTEQNCYGGDNRISVECVDCREKLSTYDYSELSGKGSEIPMCQYFAFVIFLEDDFFGRIGPFRSIGDTKDWCLYFRQQARENNIDAIAIDNLYIERIARCSAKEHLLLSRDPNEIIRRVKVHSVL